MPEEAITLLLGGIGLFLLGMMLMTDGLKAAAGPALSQVLASLTQKHAGAAWAPAFS